MTPTNYTARRFDIDALRVLAFGLLIFYHTAMLYVTDWGFHLKSAYLVDWVKFPMLLVNQWRMPLLFLVSGMASAFLLNKYGVTRFLESRLARLGLPFLAGVIVIVPPQPYLEAMANGSIDMSYAEFLWRYFTFSEWPPGAFDGSDYRFTWNHLWFIPYVMAYTVLLAPLHRLLDSPANQQRLDKLGPVGLILLPVLVQIAWKLVTDDEDINHTFFFDGYAHGIYFVFFVLGYLIAPRLPLWTLIIRLRCFTLATAICTYLGLLTLWWVFLYFPGRDVVIGVTASFNQWLWLLAVMGWSSRYLNRPYRWIAWCNARIYPWYIVHQSVMIMACYHLAKMSLGGAMEGSLVLLATLLGCYAFTAWVIPHSPILNKLFGMPRDMSREIIPRTSLTGGRT